MEAKIKEKKEIATKTLQVIYEVLGEREDFKPGQYFFVTLPKLFYPDQRGNKRHFSIVNSPNEKNVLSNATRLTDSGFKKTLSELEIGSRVEVGPISGSFVLPEETKRPLVLIAGGIGITPFMSILRFTQEESLPYKIILIYSNRDKSSTAFLDELQNIGKQNSNIELILTMTQDETWEGEKRKIDSQFIKDYTLKLKKPMFYIAGPPVMVEATVNSLHGIGVKQEDIKEENFSGY